MFGVERKLRYFCTLSLATLALCSTASAKEETAAEKALSAMANEIRRQKDSPKTDSEAREVETVAKNQDTVSSSLNALSLPQAFAALATALIPDAEATAPAPEEDSSEQERYLTLAEAKRAFGLDLGKKSIKEKGLVRFLGAIPGQCQKFYHFHADWYQENTILGLSILYSGDKAAGPECQIQNLSLEKTKKKTPIIWLSALEDATEELPKGIQSFEAYIVQKVEAMDPESEGQSGWIKEGKIGQWSSPQSQVVAECEGDFDEAASALKKGTNLDDLVKNLDTMRAKYSKMSRGLEREARTEKLDALDEAEAKVKALQDEKAEKDLLALLEDPTKEKWARAWKKFLPALKEAKRKNKEKFEILAAKAREFFVALASKVGTTSKDESAEDAFEYLAALTDSAELTSIKGAAAAKILKSLVPRFGADFANGALEVASAARVLELSTKDGQALMTQINSLGTKKLPADQQAEFASEISSRVPLTEEVYNDVQTRITVWTQFIQPMKETSNGILSLAKMPAQYFQEKYQRIYPALREFALSAKQAYIDFCFAEPGRDASYECQVATANFSSVQQVMTAAMSSDPSQEMQQVVQAVNYELNPQSAFGNNGSWMPGSQPWGGPASMMPRYNSQGAAFGGGISANANLQFGANSVLAPKFQGPGF